MPWERDHMAGWPKPGDKQRDGWEYRPAIPCMSREPNLYSPHTSITKMGFGVISNCWRAKCSWTQRQVPKQHVLVPSLTQLVTPCFWLAHSMDLMTCPTFFLYPHPSITCHITPQTTSTVCDSCPQAPQSMC